MLLVLSGTGVLLSLLKIRIFQFDFAWIAIVLCGIPITVEALIGLLRDHDITADVLVDDDVKELPHLFALSRRMMRVIKANLTFSMCLNFLAVSFAVLGILNPVRGALVHNVGSVFVIINSSFLLKWRQRR